MTAGSPVLGRRWSSCSQPPRGTAHAQDVVGLARSGEAVPLGRVALTGGVEYARITEDEGFLGAGPAWAIGVDYALTSATSIGVAFAHNHHVRDLDFFAVAHDAQGRLRPLPYVERWKGDAFFLLGTVSRAFGSRPVRPVVWGGGGLMFHGGTLRGPLVAPEIPPGAVLESGVPQFRSGRDSRALAVEGGGGLDLRLTDRYAVGPFAGLRLVNTGNFGPKYIVRSGVRIGVRW